MEITSPDGGEPLTLVSPFAGKAKTCPYFDRCNRIYTIYDTKDFLDFVENDIRVLLIMAASCFNYNVL